ncbi:MAG: adenosylcobinamide-phosphate synthase CbiB [Spirochaetaceae bacterium]|jgi:adenosylcobinamide-phosphate synthase|nr:adenosylcobinamide-phosphate synthase CbiB [Spirochaetaceae bacterium]
MKGLGFFYFGPLAILLGFLLDLLLGDPPSFPHPVRGIGFLVSRGERTLRGIFGIRERLAGTMLVAFVGLVSFSFPLAVLFVFYRINIWAGLLAETVLCWQVQAARCMQIEAMKVYAAAESGDLPLARKAVSMIVGRDTADLSMEQVIKAAVETVAENLSDGVIAPLFFTALGGPALGMLYKAVNTMDSMIGYDDERYLLFGRSAARLDDAVNWVPARLSGRLLILAASVLGFDRENAAKIYRRDRGKHASPNSGHPEAACAGALGLALAGDARYGGKILEKPAIGDALRDPVPADILSSVKLMYGAELIFLVPALAAGLALRFAVFALTGFPGAP